MRSFEIIVEPKPVPSSTHGEPEPTSGARPRRRRGEPTEMVDVLIHDANVTAHLPERHAACVLRDMAAAVLDLSARGSHKRIVRFYEDAWELCIERFGETATLSVYRAGADPSVLVYDRPVAFRDVRASVREAIDARLGRAGAERGAVERELIELRRALGEGEPEAFAGAPPAKTLVSIEPDRDGPISFASEFSIRAAHQPDGAPSAPSVEHADLHALLFRGKIRAEIRGRSLELGDEFPFVFAGRAVDLVRRALEAWERGQPFVAKLPVGTSEISLRLASAGSDDGRAALIVRREGFPTVTFPELGICDVGESVLSFARALARVVLRRDRRQGMNLRLSALRREVRGVSDALREVRRQDAVVNQSPESYRAFALGTRPPAAGGATLPMSGRLRYSEKWRALVPGIDLRATFLCGERIVVGGAHETFCLERTTGRVEWRVPTQRAAAVPTPLGIARIGTDGAIAVHDLRTGDVSLRTWIAPRVGGPCAGAVIAAPGLPRLLIVTEGERHLVALDLVSGEARWRHAWGTRGVLRIKRSGKLIYLVSGDSALTALDVQTGAVVWRMRDRLRFRTPPAQDHDALYAVAGGAGGAANLHAIDPYSGHVAWTSALAGTTCTVEGPPLLTGSSITVATRERRGLRLSAYRRDDGAPAWTSAGPVAPLGTSWLAVDDLLIGNSPTGELIAICSATGAVRYRHALGRMLDTDTPRRLEPVLRSGALFVPSVDVHVIRPTDGAHLGTIGPCEAIPDLLRVDERCDVYVAEESGHMAAFGAGPRLSLVR